MNNLPPGLTYNELERHLNSEPMCYGCGLVIHETPILGEDGEDYCADCIAVGFEETLKGKKVWFAGYDEHGHEMFKIGEPDD